MSTATESPESKRSSGSVAALEPFAATNSSVAYTMLLGLIMLFGYANRPLWHTDLWDHVNYGRQILKAGQLPETEPLVPMAHGVPMVNPAWGSQVLLAATLDSRHLGLPALQFGHGLLVVIALAAIGVAVKHQSRSTMAGIVAMLAMLFVNWQQFLVIRPQLVGVTFFSIVLAILATDQLRLQWVRWLLPLLFAVWANLHGSFSMGLTLMGVWLVGELVTAWRNTDSMAEVLRTEIVRRLLWLIPVCAAAALLNPQGLDVYREILRIGGLQNIQSMYEWAPLSLNMKQGQAAAIVCGLLVLTVVFGRQKMQTPHVLALVFFGGLAVWSSRMLNWFAPLTGLALGIQFFAARECSTPQKRISSVARTSLLNSVLNLAICGLAFAFSNLGGQTLRGVSLAPERVLSNRTPIAAAEFLNRENVKKDPAIFVPAEWSGYVLYATDARVRTLVNLHVHVMPEQLWADYMQILAGEEDALKLLDRYQIRVVMTDRSRNRGLIQRLLDSGEFRLAYEDGQAMILECGTR